MLRHIMTPDTNVQAARVTRTQKTPVRQMHQRRPNRRGTTNSAKSLQQVVTVIHNSHHSVNTET